MLRTLSNKSQLYCVVYALHNIYNTVCIVFRKLLYKLNFLFRGWLNLAKSHPEVLFNCAIAPVCIWFSAIAQLKSTSGWDLARFNQPLKRKFNLYNNFRNTIHTVLYILCKAYTTQYNCDLLLSVLNTSAITF